MLGLEDRLVSIFKNSQLNKKLLNRLEICLIDELGCIIAGRQTILSKSLNEELALPENLEQKISKWKKEVNNANYHELMKVSAGSFSTELNETNLRSITHPGSVAVPTALYLAKETEIGWNAFLEAILAGYETMITLGTSLNPKLYTSSRHSTGTCGIFGALAVAAKIKQIPEKEFRNMLSVASCLARSDFYR